MLMTKVKSNSFISCCGANMKPGGVYNISNREATNLEAMGKVEILERLETGSVEKMGETRGQTMTTHNTLKTPVDPHSLSRKSTASKQKG